MGQKCIGFTAVKQATDSKGTNSNNSSGLLTIDDLATELRVSRGTLYNWVYEKRIPYLKVGRLVRFERSAIDKYLDECRIQSLAGKG